MRYNTSVSIHHPTEAMSGDFDVRTRYGPFGDNFSPLPQPTGRNHQLSGEDEECARCGKKPCIVSCILCRGRALDRTESHSGKVNVGASYCSADCEQAHELEHHESCVARKRFGRVCGLFMDIWSMYQAETYHLPITLWPDDEQGYVDLELSDREPDERGWAGDHYALDYPEAVLPIETSNYAELAILFDHQSVDIWETGSVLVKFLLERKFTCCRHTLPYLSDIFPTDEIGSK